MRQTDSLSGFYEVISNSTGQVALAWVHFAGEHPRHVSHRGARIRITPTFWLYFTLHGPIEIPDYLPEEVQ